VNPQQRLGLCHQMGERLVRRGKERIRRQLADWHSVTPRRGLRPLTMTGFSCQNARVARQNDFDRG